MRKLIIVPVGLVLAGLVLVIGPARESKAAAGGGFTIANFKGVYVGSFTGGGNGSVNVGILRVESDGTGAYPGLRITLTRHGESVGSTFSDTGGTTVQPDGALSNTFFDNQTGFSGWLADRGRTLHFLIIWTDSGGAGYGSGTVTLQ